MAENRFVDLAMSIGVAGKIAALMLDCDRAMHALTDAVDQRWLWRLQDQRRLLLNPTLKALAALSTRMVEENPGLAGVVGPAMAELAALNPDYVPYHARVIAPRGAYLAVELRQAG